MKTTIPQLEELIDIDVSRLERDRLRHAHQALLQAGALPELPLSLQQPPVVTVRRRFPTRLPAGTPLHYLAAAAAVLALAASGTILGLSRGPTKTLPETIAMHPTTAAPRASATLTIGSRDRAGNLPITLHVSGLPALARGSFYEMYLTNESYLVAGCGTFKTDGGTTVVHLNVPYRLGEYSGWTITPAGRHQNQPLLTTNA